jgi:hypothetical protein
MVWAQVPFAGKPDSFGVTSLRLDCAVKVEHDVDILQEPGAAAGGDDTAKPADPDAQPAGDRADPASNDGDAKAATAEMDQDAPSSAPDGVRAEQAVAPEQAASIKQEPEDTKPEGQAPAAAAEQGDLPHTDQQHQAGAPGDVPVGAIKQWSVRVLLLQGLTSADREAILRGPHHEGGAHMVHSLKFVTMRVSREGSRRAGTPEALGGQWSRELDGGDPGRWVCPVYLHSMSTGAWLQLFM